MKNYITTPKVAYIVAALMTAAVMFFVVMPELAKFGTNIGVIGAEAAGSCGSCGGGGGGEGGREPSDHNGGEGGREETPKPATCDSFTVSRSTVPNGGASVNFSWTTTNATSMFISGGIGYGPVDGSTYFFVDDTETFTLTAYGAGGNDTCTVTVTEESAAPAAVATCDSFTVSRSTVPNGGASVNFSWATTNATSMYIDNGIGYGPVDGSTYFYVSDTTTFTLTAYGAGGNDTCTVTVTEQPPAAKPVASCDSFTASRTTIPKGGASVNFSWATTNATSMYIDNGIGYGPVDGSTYFYVSGPTTFTLTAYGAGGNDTCTVTITEEAPTANPAAKCLSFTANRYTVPAGGGDVTLSWNTQDATGVTISGIGSVGTSGSRTVSVSSNTTFTLTATGTGGSDTCAVSITVESADSKAPRCEYLRVNDSNVEIGDRVTLSWDTSNADTVTISPRPGSVAKSGSADVTINDETTTFTLRARSNDGQENTCSVTVYAEDEEDEDDDDEPAPRCELEVSKSRVSRGEQVTLSWDTKNADSVRIRDDHGKTIFDTSDYRSSERKRYLDGSVDIIINQATEFTLTARGDGGSRTCRVKVNVDDLAVYEKRDQGLVIALTQVPYTGFEAGPFLTFLFYAVLTLWALFIAYILVIKKGAVLGFSLYGKRAGASEAEAENRKKVEALVAKYADRNWN